MVVFICLDCGKTFCKKHMAKHEKNFHIEKSEIGECLVCKIMK